VNPYERTARVAQLAGSLVADLDALGPLVGQAVATSNALGEHLDHLAPVVRLTSPLAIVYSLEGMTHRRLFLVQSELSPLCREAGRMAELAANVANGPAEGFPGWGG
jgi:hypothetical protein